MNKSLFTKPDGTPISFCVIANPQANRIKDLIRSYGGKVKSLVANSDIVIGFEPSIENLYSYKFVEDCIRENVILDKQEFLLPIDQDAKLKHRTGKRVDFSKEDDDALQEYLSKIEQMKGTKHFHKFAETHTRHSWQSWRERALKKIIPDIEAKRKAKEKDSNNIDDINTNNEYETKERVELTAASIIRQESTASSNGISRSEVFTEKQDNLLRFYLCNHGNSQKINDVYRELEKIDPSHSFAQWRARGMKSIIPQMQAQRRSGNFKEPMLDEKELKETEEIRSGASTPYVDTLRQNPIIHTHSSDSPILEATKEPTYLRSLQHSPIKVAGSLLKYSQSATTSPLKHKELLPKRNMDALRCNESSKRQKLVSEDHQEEILMETEDIESRNIGSEVLKTASLPLNASDMDTIDQEFVEAIKPFVQKRRVRVEERGTEDYVVHKNEKDEVETQNLHEASRKYKEAYEELCKSYPNYSSDQILEALHMGSGFIWMARKILDSGFSKEEKLMWTREEDEMVNSNDDGVVSRIIGIKGNELYCLRNQYLIGYLSERRGSIIPEGATFRT